MKTHAERFRHLLKEWGLTQEEMGNLCGIKRGTVGTIVNGKTIPDADALAELLRRKPELSPDWLLMGEGEMLRGGKFNEKKAEPFFPGGTVNKFGATVMPAGALEAQFPKGITEDNGGVNKEAKPSPTNSKEFIDMLLQENDALRSDRKELYKLFQEQQLTIRSYQDSVKFLQGQVEQLQTQLQQVGKEYGNQLDAPVSYAAEPQNPIGFGRVRQMWENALVLSPASEKEAA
jgi:transcriptional regulator with XRE-family HTH domain